MKTKHGSRGTPDRLRFLLFLIGCLAWTGALAQTYVTPKMGGGQTAADMVHIDIYYDADANQLHAHVDDSHGTPELRALAPGQLFDPQASYAVLNGKAYNAQYGWNAGGLFTVPPGTAIWIEQTNASPGLEVYEGWGRLGSYTPLFGTAGSERVWRWSGVMVHNTYAVLNPTTGRLFADYHIFFGDVNTGSRAGFTHLDDVFVRLEWTTQPEEDPLAFQFGAVSQTNGAPLSFLNAARFVAASESVINLHPTNDGSFAPQYEAGLLLVAAAATEANGGPATNHAALGSCVELQVVSLTGPPSGSLGFWEPGESQPRFSVPVGEMTGTNRFFLSSNQGLPGSDPHGRIPGRHFTVNHPGLYCLGFRLVDTSTNGPSGGPIHQPSEVYAVYLQAGHTIASLMKQGPMQIAVFGGEAGKTFYLERTGDLGVLAQWETAAGPLVGTNRLQRLTNSTAIGPQGYLRLRVQEP
jgi:hypothetical protein